MRKFIRKSIWSFSLLSVLLMTGCLTPSKLDKYVASQYGNQLPKQEKRKIENINIATKIPMDPAIISTTEKSNKMLPLLVYWHWDYRNTCTLNASIGVSSFTKTVNPMANKELIPKLNGRQLELTVEQVPASFAIVDKGGAVWVLLYAIHWDKEYVELDKNQLLSCPPGVFAINDPTMSRPEISLQVDYS